jgi:putative sterol carrier protein
MARLFRDARLGTIGGGTSEIMCEIISKMVIDDVSYDTSQESGTKSQDAYSVESIMASLPKRFKSEKAKDIQLNVQFQFSSKQYTVEINDGKIQVHEGHTGTANTTVKTDDETYINLETGKLNAQEAFMSGKVQISNLEAMMKMGRLFEKLIC